MSFDSNIYYHPEKSGLRIVDELSENLSYEFNMLVVWQDVNTGVVYWGHSAGCSCPAPFEDESIADQNRLGPQNYSVFEQEVEGFPASFGERQGMLQKVREAVREFVAPAHVVLPE